MADKKISQLTAATTPLAGTEVLPIVQSGSTVKVSVDNLTAGKTVTASKVNVGTAPASTRTINVDGSVLIDRFVSTPQLAVRGGTDSTTGVELRLNLGQGGSSFVFGTIGSLGTLMSWDTGLDPKFYGNLTLNASGKSFVQYSGAQWSSGTGSPEGVITAKVGSLYSRTDGGAGTSLYVKESGTGNTGWVAK